MGQTLHVTEGIGLVQSRGSELVVLHPGDTVWTPPGGVALARRGCGALHVPPRDVGGPRDQQAPETEWGEHITDEKYAGR
jgi:hypothetical protein